MFASALLGALVDETEIEFPVFIDSPMQKFDTSHTRNILTQFYPNVSKQVILFSSSYEGVDGGRIQIDSADCKSGLFDR